MTPRYLAVLPILLLGAACDLQETIDEANADAERRARGRAAIESAIPQVTAQVMEQVGTAMSTALTAGTAPAFAPAAVQPAATETGTITIDATATPNDGGSIAVNGTIKWTMTSDEAATQINEVLTLKATWNGLIVNFNGKQYPTTGDETVEGTLDVKVADGTATWSGKYFEKGSITLEGTTYTFDIAVMVGNNAATYSGTVNGEPVSGTVVIPTTEVDVPAVNDGTGAHGTPDGAGMSCDAPSANWCIDFTGADFTSQAVAAGCSGNVRVTSCTTTGRFGRCIVDQGTGTEAVTNWYGDSSYASQYQAACSGVWIAD